MFGEHMVHKKSFSSPFIVHSHTNWPGSLPKSQTNELLSKFPFRRLRSVHLGRQIHLCTVQRMRFEWKQISLILLPCVNTLELNPFFLWLLNICDAIKSFFLSLYTRPQTGFCFVLTPKLFFLCPFCLVWFDYFFLSASFWMTFMFEKWVTVCVRVL